MTTYVFSKVQLTGRKTVDCASGCRRRLRRQRTFYQTLNPYNKNAAGVPKDRSEIYAELRADIAAWQATSETCAECDDADSGEARPDHPIHRTSRTVLDGLTGPDTGGGGDTCCDLHNRNCEPLSELCCDRCTEWDHPRHSGGSACIAPDLSGSGPDVEEGR